MFAIYVTDLPVRLPVDSLLYADDVKLIAFRNPLSAEALEKVQKLALNFVKQHSLAHQRIRGDLITMFKITHGLLKFPMASTFAHPTLKGIRGHPYRFHQQRCCIHIVVNSPSQFGLSHFGTNCRLR